MSGTGKQASEFGKKLDELNRNITTLQDLILHLKTALETVTRREVEREFLSQLTLKTSESMDKFLEERPADCVYRDWCTRRVEKATSRVLRTFTEKGAEAALEEVKQHAEAASRHFEETQCPDNACFQNIVDTFRTLEELIENSKEAAKFTGSLYSTRSWMDFDEIREREVAALLAPLSNPTRVRILKSLSKGGKNYAQLERLIGIKGGHLQFHLNSLAKAGYVTQEKPQGRYLVTVRGLKILKFLCELGELAPREEGSPEIVRGKK